MAKNDQKPWPDGLNALAYWGSSQEGADMGQTWVLLPTQTHQTRVRLRCPVGVILNTTQYVWD